MCACCVSRLLAMPVTPWRALRAFQSAWPQTRFTWIIGKLEAKLMTAILPEIEFITFDKNATLGELWRLRGALRARRFDLLLDMQLSFRASLVSSLVSAPIKLGFDRARARELQWWFTNATIAPAAHEHVLDSFMGLRTRLRHRAGRPALGCQPAGGCARVRPRHRQRREAHTADQPLLQPQRPATGRPSGMPQSPTTRRMCITCASCWSAAAARSKPRWGHV